MSGIKGEKVDMEEWRRGGCGGKVGGHDGREVSW